MTAVIKASRRPDSYDNLAAARFSMGVWLFLCFNEYKQFTGHDLVFTEVQ